MHGFSNFLFTYNVNCKLFPMLISLRTTLIFSYLLVIPFILRCQLSLHINEIMSSNGTTIADGNGDFSDWIEIYNSGDEAIDLNGFYISDKADNPKKWRFPARILEPNNYLLVFASSKDRKGSELHTNFNISKDGETIVLSDSDGNLIDLVPAIEIPRDISYGRYPDGSDNLEFFNRPSPGSSNVPSLIDDLEFSAPSGFYSQPFDLNIISNDADVTIYFTTNGDKPDTNSLEYGQNISLMSSDELADNPIIYIPTNHASSDYFYRWRSPEGTSFKANVIRAQAFKNGEPISSIISASYFIDPDYKERFDKPIISILAHEDDLYDYNLGVFVPGVTFDEYPGEPGYWTPGNFDNRGGEWEKEISMHFFESDFSLILDENLGMRIHGGYSRSLPQKSLRLYAREAMGSPTLQHEFFPGYEIQEFQTLILRNAGQGFMTTYLTDALASSIVKDWNLEMQEYRPVVLFINGAYWGMINIRERLDKHYFENKFGVEEDNLDLLEHVWQVQVEAAEGSADEYLALMEFVKNNDLSDTINYNFVADHIDIDNFIHYYLAKMYFGVYDWPGRNLELWRDRSINGKWRWIYFDNDDAMIDPNFNSYEHLLDMTDPEWPNPLWSTLLFRKLIENEKFRNDFFEATKFELLNTFHPDRTTNIGKVMAENIKDEMAHHIGRWQHPTDLGTWEYYISEHMKFLEERPCIFWNMTLDFFEKDASEHTLILCDESGVNEVELDSAVKIYPIPASEEINVELLDGEIIVEYKIYDAAGKIIENSKINPFDLQYKLTIPTLQYPPGLYIIQLQSYRGDIKRGKFILID